MKYEFPNLGKYQVGMVICESTTGIILNKKLEYSLDNKDSPYFIFESIDLAKKYANSISKSNVVFEIFNSENKLIFTKENAPKLNLKTEIKKWWEFWK